MGDFGKAGLWLLLASALVAAVLVAAEFFKVDESSGC